MKSSGLASLVLVIQFTYASEHDHVVTLTSGISVAGLSAVRRAWTSLDRLEGVGSKHHLIVGVDIGSTLPAGCVLGH